MKDKLKGKPFLSVPWLVVAVKEGCKKFWQQKMIIEKVVIVGKRRRRRETVPREF